MKLYSYPAALHKEEHATQNFLTNSAWTMDFYALCFSRCFENPTNYICCESDIMDDVGKIYYIFHMCNRLEITNKCVSQVNSHHSSPSFWAVWGGEVEQDLILTVQVSSYVQQALICVPLVVPRRYTLRKGQIGRWILQMNFTISPYSQRRGIMWCLYSIWFRPGTWLGYIMVPSQQVGTQGPALLLLGKHFMQTLNVDPHQFFSNIDIVAPRLAARDS